MTTNHPAHGHVSLDRLHQIREILSKASAQSDGGNLGYAMADAVKVIDGAIAARNAEPVVPDDGREQFEIWMLKKWGRERQEYDFAMGKFLHGENYADSYTRHMWKAWSASRAAMLQAGNSPVTPDCWVMVPKKLTAENGAKAALLGEFNLEYTLTCHECFGEGCDDCSGEGTWITTIPVDWTTIKDIWTKAIVHFAAAPQQEGK